MVYEHLTLESALRALKNAEADTAADHGEEYVETAFNDLVDSVSWDCSPEVRRELYRTTGCQARSQIRVLHKLMDASR